MKSYQAIIISALLAVGVSATASKLNQYASISDCQNDVNIISHASPAEESCQSKDARTNAVYLVVGDGAAGAHFEARSAGDCKGDDLGKLPTGQCITPPAGTGSFGFGI